MITCKSKYDKCLLQINFEGMVWFTKKQFLSSDKMSLVMRSQARKKHATDAVQKKMQNMTVKTFCTQTLN